VVGLAFGSSAQQVYTRNNPPHCRAPAAGRGSGCHGDKPFAHPHSPRSHWVDERATALAAGVPCVLSPAAPAQQPGFGQDGIAEWHSLVGPCSRCQPHSLRAPVDLSFTAAFPQDRCCCCPSSPSGASAAFSPSAGASAYSPRLPHRPKSPGAGTQSSSLPHSH
jgi:hypothetical protein